MQSNASTNAVLVFEDREFDIVDIHNEPWLRGSQIASALGYSNPSRSISEIYDRNTDEFTDEMTQIVELETAGGRQQVRIFSLRGCHLLGMLAKTTKAKEFRRWVLDILEGRALPREVGRVTVPQQISLHRLLASLVRTVKEEKSPGVRRALYAQIVHVSRLLGLPVPPLEQIGSDDPQEKLPGV